MSVLVRIATIEISNGRQEDITEPVSHKAKDMRTIYHTCQSLYGRKYGETIYDSTTRMLKWKFRRGEIVTWVFIELLSGVEAKISARTVHYE